MIICNWRPDKGNFKGLIGQEPRPGDQMQSALKIVLFRGTRWSWGSRGEGTRTTSPNARARRPERCRFSVSELDLIYEATNCFLDAWRARTPSEDLPWPYRTDIWNGLDLLVERTNEASYLYKCINLLGFFKVLTSLPRGPALNLESSPRLLIRCRIEVSEWYKRMPLNDIKGHKDT